MKNNVRRYAYVLTVCGLLGFDTETMANRLRDAYLVSEEEQAHVLRHVASEQYGRISTLPQLAVWESCLLMGAHVFGASKEEKAYLEIKRAALYALADALGEKWQASDLWEQYQRSALGRFVVGAVYYYGIGRKVNESFGYEQILAASRQGSADAVIWRLHEESENAKELLEMLVALREVKRQPDWADEWLARYDATDLSVEPVGRRAIGFTEV